jgi:hypothetical protein
VHQLLSLYDLGAPASIIHAGYTREKSYQRPLSAETIDKEEEEALDLQDSSVRKSQLGQRRAYSSFLAYFTAEIAEHGIAAVLEKTLFSGTAEADDMLVRLFGGLYHPFIHVGYGLEFWLPAIVAEGLAMAAVEDAQLRGFLVGAEEKARATTEKTGATTEKTGTTTLVRILEEMRKDEKVRRGPRWEDKLGGRVKGLLKRAGEDLQTYAARWVVPVETLQQKMAESVNAAALFTAAAQRPDKEIKIDFLFVPLPNVNGLRDTDAGWHADLCTPTTPPFSCGRIWARTGFRRPTRRGSSNGRRGSICWCILRAVCQSCGSTISGTMSPRKSPEPTRG